MNDELVVRPRIAALSEAQIAQVHERSLQVLSSVGVRVDSMPAARILARAASNWVGDDRRVRLSRDAVEWALEVSPKVVPIYSRWGNLAFRLGETETRFGLGVTALYYQDPDNDRPSPFDRSRLSTVVRLGDVLPSFDVVSTPGVLPDAEPKAADLYTALEMVSNTSKPLVMLVSDANAFPVVLDLFEHLHGDLNRSPFVVPYLNPISPLVINGDTVDKMLTAIRRGLPIIFSNYGMAGATTPISAVGALVLLNAELLAGLTLAQLAKEGTPVILGSLPAYLDMKGMGSFYDPISYVLNLACAEIMAWYQIPHCGTSGSGMGWGPDLITSGHQWINHLTSCIGKVGLAPFVGDSLGSKALSPATLVYANEVIAQARRFAQGFSLASASRVVEEIAAVGPGNNYLTSAQTVEQCHSAYYSSDVFAQLTYESWLAQGHPKAMERLRSYTQQLLNDLRPLRDHDELVENGECFIREGLARLP